MLTSTRFFVLTGNAEGLANALINSPKIIGARRAQMLLDLAIVSDNKLGRIALQKCAKAANRHRVIFDGAVMHTDRVFGKASTKRLFNWAQNKNTPV